MDESNYESSEEYLEQSTAVVYYVEVDPSIPIQVFDPYSKYLLFGIVVVLAALAIHNIFKHIRGTGQ